MSHVATSPSYVSLIDLREPFDRTWPGRPVDDQLTAGRAARLLEEGGPGLDVSLDTGALRRPGHASIDNVIHSAARPRLRDDCHRIVDHHATRPRRMRRPVSGRRWIDEADRVLIGAGAGLSADVGVDYTDEAVFARTYPALVQRGLRARIR